MPIPAQLAAFQLQPVPDTDAVPTDWARYRNRRRYALDAEGHLVGLNLCGCEVKDAAFLQSPDFQYLKALNLSENALSKLHLPAHLQHLQHLNVEENPKLLQLTLPGPLPTLETFTANECALLSLELPAGMHRLRHLDLRKNRLNRLVFEAECGSLSFLDASQNELSELHLPAGFAALQYLYLNDNGLYKLHFDEPVEHLEVLHLRGNQLQDLPEGLVFFSSLKTLYLHGNPLPHVPKGTSGVPEGERDNAASAVHNYLRSITEDGAIPNDEVKLVLLGNSTAGKSSLLRYLREGRFLPNLVSTHGIANELWPDSGLGFKVNVWDFGGQEFYHATHRLFLSHNAVSLVAFEADTNRQDEIELRLKLYEDGQSVERDIAVETFHFTYWLDNLRYFCKGKQASALLVQTKMDCAKSVEITDNERKIYQLPADTPRISVRAAAQGDPDAAASFQVFKTQLFDALRGAIGQYPFSRKWLLIKNDLRSLPADQNMMAHDDYVRFCERLRPGISQKEAGRPDSMLDTLSDYLHETGVVLWYRDHPELRKTVFVKPKWVTETIYKVLDYKVMERDGGQFDRGHTARVAPGMDTDDLLALMIKFELIFPVGNKPDTYIAPQYLPSRDPRQVSGSLFAELADDCRLLLFTLRFPQFLPRSVMTRFMCRYGPLAEGKYWKDGIIFKKDGTWVWANRSATFDITLRATALPPSLGPELFATFRDITDQNPDLLISPNGSDFVRIGDLLDPPPGDDPALRATNGNWVNLSAFAAILGGREAGLLGLKSDGLTSSQPIAPPPPGKPKIYFSYAWGDPDETGESREKIVDELYESLTQDGFDVRRDKMSLEYGGLISTFMDEIGTGLVVVFVSDKYARSPYCMNELFEIARNGKLDRQLFSERVLPIAVERIKFDDPDVLEIYFDHWEKEESKWVAFVQKRISQVTEAQTRRLHITKKIRQHSGDLYDWLTDMNAKTQALLRDNDFAEVKKRILALTQKLQNAP